MTHKTSPPSQPPVPSSDWIQYLDWPATLAPGQHLDSQFMDTEPAPALQVLVGEAELAAAVQQGVITPAQASALWREWAGAAQRVAGTVHGQPWSASPPRTGAAAAHTTAPRPSGPRFTAVYVLYYFGGMLAISAMALFMTLGWQILGTWGLFALTALYLVGALKVADHLQQRHLPTPAGILATLAVCLVPLLVWCVQNALGLWPVGGSATHAAYHTLIDWRWLTLEFATLAAGVVMLWRYRLPFMVMPLAVTLWYMSMDVANALLQQHGWDWQLTRDVSLVFGLGTCALAMAVDIRTRRATEAVWQQDFAFWLYLFGAIMFWSSLSLHDSGSEWAKAGYALLNVALVFGGAAIGRRVFTVLGAFGVTGYLGYLSYRVFKDSLLFPLLLTFLGLAVVLLGIWWQRHETQINARLRAWLPADLQPR